MKLPNADQAIIPREKLYGYLLSSAHPVGRFKARFFAKLGYKSDTWQRFESDLRSQHLSQEATLVESNDFGRKYEIRASLRGALGSPQSIVSIWFIPKDGDTPRFVTAYPGDAP